uniref:Uncharacterized protein n=1 Tax=Arundo donax TaxID=35708 RepID=A0A0A9HUZ0_ARUDO
MPTSALQIVQLVAKRGRGRGKVGEFIAGWLTSGDWRLSTRTGVAGRLCRNLECRRINLI